MRDAILKTVRSHCRQHLLLIQCPLKMSMHVAGKKTKAVPMIGTRAQRVVITPRSQAM